MSNTLNAIRVPNNHTDVDLKKVAYANFFYKNQEGLERRLKPRSPSVRGITIDSKTVAGYHPEYPGESLLERSRRLDILDRWTPVLILTLSNGHRLTYTGDKAITINAAWRSRIYSKQL